MDIFDKHASIKSKRVKHETQPEWINDKIKMAMKNRDAYHKLKDWIQNKEFIEFKIKMPKSFQKKKEFCRESVTTWAFRVFHTFKS